MLASQQFCVKWNSYSSNLQNVFPRLLTSEHFVDITLACEGQMIKCHKVVLSACSTYFEKLLIQNPCQHPIIFMKDMKHWEVQALVDFMYKGEVNVSQDELNSLLVAAEALQIRGLCGSDSTNRNPQDPPKINSPTVSPPKVPPVSLPHDTVLSGSSSFGRESPPAIKRKRSNDEKDVIPKITNAMPTTQGRSPSVPNNSEGNSLLAQSSGDVDRNSKIEGQAEEGSEEEKKVIKQEIDMDDTFGDGEVDGDAADEDYANQGQQDDSDSTLREDGLGPSLLDQPGPSGMIPAGDKTATDKPESLPCYTKSKFGRPKLILSGYVYTHQKTKPNKIEWRCERRYTCSGKVTLSSGTEEILRQSNHTHSPDKSIYRTMEIFSKEEAMLLLQRVCSVRSGGTWNSLTSGLYNNFPADSGIHKTIFYV